MLVDRLCRPARLELFSARGCTRSVVHTNLVALDLERICTDSLGVD